MLIIRNSVGEHRTVNQEVFADNSLLAVANVAIKAGDDDFSTVINASAEIIGNISTPPSSDNGLLRLGGGWEY